MTDAEGALGELEGILARDVTPRKAMPRSSQARIQTH